MVMIEGSTVVGVFEECARAEDAVADLERAGFRTDQIGIVEPEGGGTAGGVTVDDAPNGDPGARIMGAAIGTLLGASSAVLLPVRSLAGEPGRARDAPHHVLLVSGPVPGAPHLVVLNFALLAVQVKKLALRSGLGVRIVLLVLFPRPMVLELE